MIEAGQVNMGCIAEFGGDSVAELDDVVEYGDIIGNSATDTTPHVASEVNGKSGRSNNEPGAECPGSMDLIKPLHSSS